jgi:hypothetical protein
MCVPPIVAMRVQDLPRREPSAYADFLGAGFYSRTTLLETPLLKNKEIGTDPLYRRR